MKKKAGLIYRLRGLHGKIHDLRVEALPILIKKMINPKIAFLVLTPEHRNLGDHAIAQAESILLAELDVSYIEITDKKLNELKRLNALNVFNGRAVFISGGGYLGTLWIKAENMVREIIENNKKSRIILFPNTIYFDNNELGKNEFKKSKEIYNNHRYLKLFARETYSYHIMNNAFKDTFLVPDMVLMMNQCRADSIRKGCVLCLRSDLEKTRLEEEEQLIMQQIKDLFGESILLLDMIRPNNISCRQRNEELEHQYNAFRQAQLVITDRLHGMIFSAITGTPCIVINSKSPKMKGCYEWIKDLGYIRFCEDVSQIKAIYSSILLKEWQYDNSKLLRLYEPLRTEIMKAVSKS